MQWTTAMVRQLKLDQADAVARKAESFMFFGRQMMTAYAKYLIEYIDGVLTLPDKPKRKR